MKRLIIFIIIVVVIVLVSSLVSKQINTPSNQRQLKTTVIIDYMPSDTSTSRTIKEGSCWTGSNVASSNLSAYRCTVGHELYDPCFETKGKKVICLVNPNDDSNEFELKLTEPLPDNSSRADKDSGLAGWVVELDNGIVCTKFSGTAGGIPGANGETQDMYFYTCSDKSVIAGYIDSSEPLWRARTAVIKADGSDYQTHNILKVWR